METSRIYPVLEVNKPKTPADYRPISILTLLSKIHKSVILYQMTFLKGELALCLTIIAESTHNVASIVSVSVGKKLKNKGIRQAGLIIPK